VFVPLLELPAFDATLDILAELTIEQESTFFNGTLELPKR
jgi:hypothetical protein